MSSRPIQAIHLKRWTSLATGIGGEAHQCHRHGEADQQHRGMLARRGSDGEDVVEAHRQIGKRDLDRGLEEGLASLRALDRRGVTPGSSAVTWPARPKLAIYIL